METTNPITGTTVSTSGFGTPVYDDLSKLANSGILPLGSATGSVNITATTYADVTGVTLAYTKRSSASKLAVLLTCTGTCTGTTSYQTTMGVNIGGTDYDVAFLNWNTASDHRTITGLSLLSGVNAGNYTIQVRSKNSASGHQTTFDSNDRFSMLVLEIP